MRSFYLRKMYQQNLLVEPGGITLDGVPRVDSRKDGVLIRRARCLPPGTSAGVVNPARRQIRPLAEREHPAHPGRMAGRATEVAGSWWPAWDKWVSQFAGGEVPA